MVKKRVKRKKDTRTGEKKLYQKKKIKKTYWRWRKGKIGREDCLQEKRRFKELLKKKQREKREEEKEELRN